MKARMILALFTTALLILGVVGGATAQFVNNGIDDTDLMLWCRNTWSPTGSSIDAGYPLDVAGPGVQWSVSISNLGWQACQIGDDYAVGIQDCSPNSAITYGFPTSGYANLSSYQSMQFVFTNNSSVDWVQVEIIVNGGPPGYIAAHSPGQWLAPLQTGVETLDLTTVVNRTQSPNISFQVGANFGTGDYMATHIDVTVSPAIPKPDEVWVDATWAGSLPGESVGAGPYTFGYDAFATIQDGINGVAGSTVNVAPGLYQQDLTIYQDNLELKASGAPPTIKGVATLPWGSWPLAAPNIDVRADNVKIHGFTITSPDVADGYYSSGIVLDGLSNE
ncbi:hypothetical protein ACFL2Z_05480, partial [Candidatus Eisenbacteria bacterium]